jgi:NAD(P)-dependent dehydrogenase (short-subunit alcohol dehydrogenase family)
VRAEIVALFPQAAVDIVECDLASLASVRNCVAEVRERYAAIQLLINNAGIVSLGSRMSVDGFELTFATNHQGPFLLTELLRDRLDPACGRIVNVASRMHALGRLDLDRVRDPRARYAPRAAYARSKLANVLYTFALARRLAGTRITANCLHPGVVSTHLLPRWLEVLRPLVGKRSIDSEQGARTTLHLALSPEVAGTSGEYFNEHQQSVRAAPSAYDIELQERLWKLSTEWVSA